MSKLVKNTTIYTIGNLLPQVAGFILLPIYTRYLSPADYGIVNSMQVLSAVLLFFFTLAVERAVYRLYYEFKTETEKKRYLGSISIIIAIISVVVLAITFLLKDYIGMIYKSIPFYPYYFYAILTSFVGVFTLIPKIYYQIIESASKFVILSVIQFLANSALVLVYIILFKEGAAGMLKGQLIGNIIIVPLFIILNLKIIAFSFDWQMIKESLKFSIPMIPSLLSAWIINMLDRVFIERYYTLTDVGIYSLAYKIASILLIVTSAFFLAYNPVFYKTANSLSEEEAKPKLIQYNTKLILAVLFMSFVIIVFSKEVIYLFLDRKYIDAYKLVPLLALGLVFSQITGLVYLSIYQMKKTKEVMYMIMISSLLSVLMNFVLIPKYGPFGAAIAALLTYIFQFAINYLYSRKCYFVPILWRKVLPIFISLNVIAVALMYIDISIYLSLVIKLILITLIAASAIRVYNDSYKSFFVNLKGYIL